MIAAGPPTVRILTPRQEQICALRDAGATTRQIARLLSIHIGTVRTHLRQARDTQKALAEPGERPMAVDRKPHADRIPDERARGDA